MKGENKIHNIVIPDGSILIKLIAKEKEDKEQTERFLKDIMDKKITCIIPSIALWEINNFIGRNFPKIGMAVFTHFRLLGFTEATLSLKIAALTFNIMDSCPKVSFYDASYHALALHSGGTFITADQKYYEQAKKWKNIRLLKDYGN